jgi:hypothetical protein
VDNYPSTEIYQQTKFGVTVIHRQEETAIKDLMTEWDALHVAQSFLANI